MAEGEPHRPNPSRRRFLGGALGTAGIAVGVGAGFGIARASEPSTSAKQAPNLVPFYGKHQAGIATPAQDRLAFASFDLTSPAVNDVRTMLALWASAAAQMTKGLPIGAVETAPQASPIDTGEALGLGPSNLTITVGFGPKFFDDRLGLQHKMPAALDPLPSLPTDDLHVGRSGGDIGVQACADDPTVAFHVIRNFARLARGTAVMRWSQLGFGRTASTSDAQETERNLLGFKDGTRNIKDQSAADFDRFVWVGDETDQAWMKGGSYLVTRRIRMFIENWDVDTLADQERVFGRKKNSGAPLTGTAEFDTPDLAAKGTGGALVIDPNAHIRLASPDSNSGQKILRRGYSYTDGIDTTTGLLDAGLFFIAYQKDAHKQFVPIQTRLGSQDSLNEYIRHTSSALFAVPPGLSAAGDYYGKAFFA